MTRNRRHHGLPQIRHAVDDEGELVDVPPGLAWVWVTLAVLLVVEALGELGWIGGPHRLYDTFDHDALLAAAAALMVGRAWFEPVGRRAWMAFGAAMAVWCLASVSWSVAYASTAHPPYPTFADVLWLAWYPLMAVGLVFLVRVRLHHFEFHRWMDGIAVTLLALVAGIAFIVQPATDHSGAGRFATVVDFSYPVLDVLLIGAVLGIYGLLGWRPDAMWILVGAGVLAMAVADAEFAVQQARGVATGDRYDSIWTLGALLIAFAAWVPTPKLQAGHAPVTGMRAIALALVAQVIAIAIQGYAAFHEIGRSERVLTIIVLVIASVQIFLTRPRPRTADPPAPDGEGPETA